MLVKFSGPLRAAAGGTKEVELEAAQGPSTIRELLNTLRARYPDFGSALDNNSVAVAINGEIYRDDWSTLIAPDAEIVLLPRIQGG